MISLNINLGQIILTAAIAIIGYLIKRHVDQFDKKLDQFDERISKHEEIIYQINSNVQQLVGVVGLRSQGRSHGR